MGRGRVYCLQVQPLSVKGVHFADQCSRFAAAYTVQFLTNHRLAPPSGQEEKQQRPGGIFGNKNALSKWSQKLAENDVGT